MLPLNLCLTLYKSLYFLCAFYHVWYCCYYIIKKINYKPSQQCNFQTSWCHTEGNSQNLDNNSIFLKIKKAYKECLPPQYIMVSVDNSIKVLSANCQGLQNIQKRVDVLSYMKDRKANIIGLQDTHWTEKDLLSVKQIWGNECYLNGTLTNSRVVTILLNKNFEYQITSTKSDSCGHFLYLGIKLSSMTINLINIYAPNNDKPNFFSCIKDFLLTNHADYTVICGDFNLVLDQTIDTKNYKHVNNPNAQKAVKDMMNELNLLDIYRLLHPNVTRFTWRKRNPIKHARLDFFLISDVMTDIVKTCNIGVAYRSDHSVIELELFLNKFTVGKGIWKFNNSLLKSQDYLSLINNAIDDEILKYALPIYSLQFLKQILPNITFTIDDDLFLEMLFLRIRGDTIKYASSLKKHNKTKEDQLLKDIAYLESQLDNNSHNYQLLMDKQLELENLRKLN